MKNGKPAFPVIGGHSQGFGPFGEGDNIAVGISTRLYVSTKILQGMLASGQSNIVINEISLNDVGFEKLAVYMADKLIAECEKE